MIPIFFLIVWVAIIIWLWCGYLWETFQMSRRSDRVLYHGSTLSEQGPILEEIVKRYIVDKGQKTDKYLLIEPGAGLGKVADYLARRFSWKAVEAVELGGFILFFGRLRAVLIGSKISFMKEDLFAHTYKKPAFVYCYLFPAMLEKLYKEKHLEGTLMVSLTFAIPDCKPTEKIPLQSWQKEMFVYDFRKISGASAKN